MNCDSLKFHAVAVETVVCVRVCVFLQHRGFLYYDNLVSGKVFLFAFKRTSSLLAVLVCFEFVGRNGLKMLREHGEHGVVSCGAVVVFVVTWSHSITMGDF